MKKIALVHDWLVGMRGGERVFEVLCDLYPQADVYTLVYEPSHVSETIRKMKIHTPWSTRHIGFLRRHYRWLLPLMPDIIEDFKLDGYDLVISTSHCVAKGVRVPEDTPHLCYCFTPMRYLWDKYDDYFGSYRKLASWIMPFFAGSLRRWDVSTVAGIRQFITSSEYVRERIRRHYSREAIVVPPPVECARFAGPRHPEDFFLTVGALEPYKRIDVAIKACSRLNIPLKVAGTGSEFKALSRLAGPKTEMLGFVSDTDVADLMSRARCLLFPSDEDFGIVPLEAAAAGCPVIAYGHGGALETVVDGQTGLFFAEQTPESLMEAISRFAPENFDESVMRNHAALYDYPVFREKMSELITALSSADRTIKFQSVGMAAKEMTGDVSE